MSERIFFQFDVFLSHSSRDKLAVRALAERLRADGIHVWLDEWEIRPSDNIPYKTEQGLESSRVLVFCMSKESLGPDWATLEGQTLRFRDPLNKQRRFILVRFDDAGIRESLQQFQYVDWRQQDSRQYQALLESCRRMEFDRDNGVVPPAQREPAQSQIRADTISLGHVGSIRSVAFSPDGRLALTGSEDDTARLWDVKTGRALRVLEGHAECVASVAFSSDGRLALTGSKDHTVRLWEVETGSIVRVFKGHSNRVESVAFSPDSRLALSGSTDRTVRLWEVETGRELHVLERHSAAVKGVAFSPDGRLALSGSEDRTMRLWHVESRQLAQLLRGHSDSVRSVAFSPNGRFVLSGSNDGSVRLWELETGHAVRLLSGHSGWVLSVAFSPDGRLALSGSADQTVRLWELQTGQELQVMERHSHWVWSVAFSPDGRLALSGSDDWTVRLWDLKTGDEVGVLDGHSSKIASVAFSPNATHALSGSEDRTIRLWDLNTGRTIRVMKGHSGSIRSVAFSMDGRMFLSGSDDRTIRLWDVGIESAVRLLEGHSDRVWGVAFSPDGQLAISGSSDRTVRLWELERGQTVRVLEGHSDRVCSVAFSPDGRLAISGSDDKTVRLWILGVRSEVKILEGHSARLTSVAFSPDGRLALSGSADQTVRVWEVETGRAVRVLEGHSGWVWSVAFSPDGRFALSGSTDQTVRLWEVATGRSVRVMQGHSATVRSLSFNSDGQIAFSSGSNGVARLWNLSEPYSTSLASCPGDESQVQYTNAKVLLVGESGTGKTGLAMRLARDEWSPTESTTGAWATQLKLPNSPPTAGDGVDRAIWLWDFGGQADQRLIHQLYMEDTALAVLVFDGQRQDLFEFLGQWDRDITRSSRKPFPRLLVAGRIDVSGLRVSHAEIEEFVKERGFQGKLIQTSAKTSEGCRELKEAIINAIDWDAIAQRSSPRLFRLLEEKIIQLKDQGRILMRWNELRDALQLRLAGQNVVVEDREVRTVVGLLKGPGVVWELGFGSWVLLQPELINNYAQAVIQTLRSDEHELGMIAEERVLQGILSFPTSCKRLPKEEERILLLAMHTYLIERGVCLREHAGKNGPLLVFPSYYRRERPELTGHPAVLATFRFHGFLDEIYATLVVRLHHTEPFDHEALWRYAADFKTLTGKKLGIKLTRLREGAGELQAYCDPSLPIEEKMLFCRFVYDHLMRNARDVERFRHYTCPHCHTPVRNTEIAAKRLAGWLNRQNNSSANATILCVDCERRIPLWDELEQLFASQEMLEKARHLSVQSQHKLDNESKDRALVGDVISTVALAGQISRELPVSDHGIDMEIEFKDDNGTATGSKLYLQLKSGDSHTRERRRDDTEIFDIPKSRLATYWQQQAFPVMLVIRNSEGEIRWMEIRDWLRHESDFGRKPVRQIVFKGERFDAVSVRRWRDQLLKDWTGKRT